MSTTSDDSLTTTTPASDQSIDITPHDQTKAGLGDDGSQSTNTDGGAHDGSQTDVPTDSSTNSSATIPTAR